MTEVAGFDATAFRARVEALDVSLFKSIKSQTKHGDRASLLALQAACVARFGTFAYLEIGSHLGGSLQAFVRDPAVSTIVSIDLRPETAHDDRGKAIPYHGNSTQRMLDLLAELPGADLAKIHTIDADSRTIDPAQIPVRPQLCFIDGEHTYESCLADARFCRAVAAPDATLAFHDTPIIHPAIRDFLDELRRDGVVFRAYPVPDTVFVIELGGAGLHRTPAIRRLLREETSGFDPLAGLLARRAGGGERPAARLALQLWLSPAGAGRRRRMRRWRKSWSKQVKVRRRRLNKRADAVVARLRRR